MTLSSEIGPALPKELLHLAGRITDVDTHEMMPAQVWVQECGALAEPLVEEWLNNGQDASVNPNHPNVPGYSGDDAPVAAADIWLRKGSRAPGAVSLGRRDAVMDAMGVRRQLMFATGVGMWGVFFVTNEKDTKYSPGIREGRREYGKALVKAYNDWAMRAMSASARVRPVLPLIADSVDELMAGARVLLDAGVRGLWLPSAELPGGRSPAHPDLDPFWEMAAARDACVCLHVGADQPLQSAEWRNAPVFEGFRLLGEFSVDPWSLSVNYLTTQNFLATAVLGGVFERHPDLRFGVIETGGYWIGPLCDQMDMWYAHSQAFGTEKTFRLPHKPSDYIRRNVRASCFDFEPVGQYVSRYGLEDVFCFASDYPHVEGGQDPVGRFLDSLRPLGPEVVEKFFVRNGEWLLPE
jgi:predicted TIM-barrel fold metal-dependent hydrolase